MCSQSACPCCWSNRFLNGLNSRSVFSGFCQLSFLVTHDQSRQEKKFFLWFNVRIWKTVPVKFNFWKFENASHSYQKVAHPYSYWGRGGATWKSKLEACSAVVSFHTFFFGPTNRTGNLMPAYLNRYSRRSRRRSSRSRDSGEYFATFVIDRLVFQIQKLGGDNLRPTFPVRTSFGLVWKCT